MDSKKTTEAKTEKPRCTGSALNDLLTANSTVFVTYKNRTPGPGKCKILAINFERQELEVTNGAVRLWPSFVEVVLFVDAAGQSLGDDFQDMKEDSKQKRSGSRVNSSSMLVDEKIQFDSKNGGAHLIVEGNKCMIDFWPGTGKWHCRSGKKGFGVKNLIEYINGT